MKHSIIRTYKQTEGVLVIETFYHNYELYFDFDKLIMAKISGEKFFPIYDNLGRLDTLNGNNGSIYTFLYPRTKETIITDITGHITWYIDTSLEDVAVISNTRFPNILYNVIFDGKKFIDFTYEDLDKVGVN